MTPQETIQPVNNSYEPGRPDVGALPGRAQAENPAPAAREKPVGNEKTAPAEKPAAQETKVSSAAGGSPWNIRMRFEVEPESKQVTVLIIDRQSQKVIRTIPADQLEKMQQGDLLELYI